MIADRRILITGAARGIGAATARRLHERGARLALLGLEPAELEKVAAACGGAPFFECDVTDRAAVEAAVEGAVERLGGLDVFMANAGVAAQLPLLGGDPEIYERTIAVNALLIASLAAALHLPLLAAYSSSKAAVEALGNVLRIELQSSGAKVGVGYFAEIDTDMTSRGFGTEAATTLTRKMRRPTRAAPLSAAVDAIERGIDHRSRRVVAPRWVAPLLPARMVAQRAIEAATRGRVDDALEIARREHAGLTTPQP